VRLSARYAFFPNKRNGYCLEFQLLIWVFSSVSVGKYIHEQTSAMQQMALQAPLKAIASLARDIPAICHCQLRAPSIWSHTEQHPPGPS
jgi:hypothetical protein